MRQRVLKKAMPWVMVFLSAQFYGAAISHAAAVDWKEDLRISRQTTLVPDRFLHRFDPVTLARK